MPRKKLRRFAEVMTFANVFPNPLTMKGRWHEAVFKNHHPLTLELACGKGEYTVALARQFPAGNFIGVDAKGARLWTGAKIALTEGLSNAAFLKGYIENLADFFAANEVQEIWITFPEPHPENTKAKKRLTGPRFLQMYRSILAPGGMLHLKTDDLGLFEFTLKSVTAASGDILEAVTDLHRDEAVQCDTLLAIQTTYERRYAAAGKSIKYVRFRL